MCAAVELAIVPGATHFFPIGRLGLAMVVLLSPN